MSDIADEMRAWAQAQAQRYIPQESAKEANSAGYVHPLERARDFAPMTRKRAALKLLGRDGTARRRIMGIAAGKALVPKWVCDPVPTRETRARTPQRHYAIDYGSPLVFRWIDEALAELTKSHPLRAKVLREEFLGQGSQLEKSKLVARWYGGKFTKWMYRKELQSALDWMEGRKR